MMSFRRKPRSGKTPWSLQVPWGRRFGTVGVNYRVCGWTPPTRQTLAGHGAGVWPPRALPGAARGRASTGTAASGRAGQHGQQRVPGLARKPGHASWELQPPLRGAPAESVRMWGLGMVEVLGL